MTQHLGAILGTGNRQTNVWKRCNKVTGQFADKTTRGCVLVNLRTRHLADRLIRVVKCVIENSE